MNGIKTMLTFGAGALVGSYCMYNKLYRHIANIALSGSDAIKKPDQDITQENREES